MMKYYVYTMIVFVLLTTTSIFAADGDTGSISGRLMCKDGGSMAGGKVFIFRADAGPPPVNDKYWRVPDKIADITSDGRFSITLAEGNYFIRAIKRSSGNKMGPPDEGDYIFSSYDENGKTKLYSVKNNENIDIGTVAEAVPYKKKAVDSSNLTAIEGTVFDAQKRPIAGVLVLALKNPKIAGKPLFASERTGKDGKYILRVSGGDTYYLRARSGKGGAPVPGEMIGQYGSEERLRPVKVETGKIIGGIDITLAPFSFKNSSKKEKKQ